MYKFILHVLLVCLLIVKAITAHRVVNSRTATLKVTGVTTATTTRTLADKPVTVTVKGNQSKKEADYHESGTVTYC